MAREKNTNTPPARKRPTLTERTAKMEERLKALETSLAYAHNILATRVEILERKSAKRKRRWFGR